MYKEVVKIENNNQYPEISKQSGLSNALNEAFLNIGSSLRADALEDDLPFNYASVTHKNNDSQIVATSHDKKISIDCWRDGVSYGSWWLPDLDIASKVIHDFVALNFNVDKMRKKYKWFKSKIGKIHESGADKFVEHIWGQLHYLKQEPEKSLMRNLYDAVKVSSKIEQLKVLMPYTSLTTLCFSKTTGYPFSDVDIKITSLSENRFRVFFKDSDIETLFDKSTLHPFLKENVPDYGKAYHGTGEDE